MPTLPAQDLRFSDLCSPESVFKHIPRPSREISWEKSQPEQGNGLGVGSCMLGASPEVRSQPQEESPAIIRGCKGSLRSQE